MSARAPLVGQEVGRSGGGVRRSACHLLLLASVALASDANAGGEPYPEMLVGPRTKGGGPSYTTALADFGVFALPSVALWGAGLTIETDRTGRANTPHAADLAAARVSDYVAFGGAVLVGVGPLLLEGSRLGWGPEFTYSSVIAAEAFGLSTGLNQVLKRTAGRCRPVAYVQRADGTYTCDPSRVPASFDPSSDPAYLSWPSGHVAGIGGVTGAYLGLAFKTSYYREPVWQYWLAGGVGALLTGVTASLRVKAGAHSWGDTLGSAAISIPAGVIVALLHPLGRTPSKAGTGAAAMDLTLLPRSTGFQIGGTF